MAHYRPDTVKILGNTGSYDIWAIQPKEWQAGGWTIVAMSEDEKKFWSGNTQNICRLETGKDLIPSLAIRITFTEKSESGWKYNRYNNKEIKIKITFLGDCEPDTYTTGIAWFE
jgi:hypothetical protein